MLGLTQIIHHCIHNGAGMDPYESNTHSFIVKIWIEEFLEGPGQVLWRGRVTHVPDGRQSYFHNLEELVRFIRSYLQEMGGPHL